MISRILILDDEPFVGAAVSRELRSAGFDCVAVQDPDAAWALLQSGDISVVVSDHLMPKCTGVEFLERCAREYPTVSQILLTGHADVQIAAAAIHRTQVRRLILKPWSRDELVEAVREAAWTQALLADEAESRLRFPPGPHPVQPQSS